MMLDIFMRFIRSGSLVNSVVCSIEAHLAIRTWFSTCPGFWLFCTWRDSFLRLEVPAERDLLNNWYYKKILRSHRSKREHFLILMNRERNSFRNKQDLYKLMWSEGQWLQLVFVVGQPFGQPLTILNGHIVHLSLYLFFLALQVKSK